MEADFVADVCMAVHQCQSMRRMDLYGSFHPEGDSRGYADDATWIMTSSFVIFTMQTGFGLLEMGSCSAGHEVNIMLKNVVDVVCGSLAYYLFGYAISFGTPSNHFMGYGNFVPTGGVDSTYSGLLFSRYIFQLSFAATSTTIVSGCVAMRLRFFVYCGFSFYAIFVYSFLAHWIWASDGWLAIRGIHDFAGGSPVHVLGGVSGFVAICFLGPRTGRFDGTRPYTDFLPASPSSILFGLFMLWWGWIGFNCGSTFGVTDDRWVVATRTAIVTVNASSAGGVIGILLSLGKSEGKMVYPEDITNGILGSLVAITPCCDCVHTYAAFMIGAMGALVAIRLNDMMPGLCVDDPVGAIGVHLGSGVWGLIAVALFSDNSIPGTVAADGFFYGGGFALLKIQLMGICVTLLWGGFFSSLYFYLVGIMISGDFRNPRKGLRVAVQEELEGADSFLHGIEDWQRDLPRRPEYPSKNNLDDSKQEEDGLAGFRLDSLQKAYRGRVTQNTHQLQAYTNAYATVAQHTAAAHSRPPIIKVKSDTSNMSSGSKNRQGILPGRGGI